VNRPQLLVGIAALLSVAALLLFGKTEADMHTRADKPPSPGAIRQSSFTTDSMLRQAKSSLNPAQALRLNELESSMSRGDIKAQQIKANHDLSHFWGDIARVFEPYAWYEAEAARLENSEKNLIFAARLFLGNIRSETNTAKKKWIAQQAKDLYERSLSVNPSNDSAKVELGIAITYGELSPMPMEGIQKIREVLTKDSTNIYALTALGDASVHSMQYDRAIERFKKILSLEPQNLDAILKLADAYTMMGKRTEAIEWYKKSLPLLKRDDWKQEVQKRIDELK
jgi:tetratricopeptide (TPR) repeat protein